MSAAVAVAPRLRLLPAPLTEPLDRGERLSSEPELPATQGTLALAFAEPAGGPGPDFAPSLAPTRYVSTAAAIHEDELFGPQLTSSALLPEPRVWAAQMVRAAVEVVGGTRSASQLVRWTTEAVHQGLCRRAAVAARLARTTARGGSRNIRPAVVRSVRVCQPADGVAEVTAVVQDRGRVRAVAMRMEGLDGRWRVCALEMG